MKTKYILSLGLLACHVMATAQTMRWVPVRDVQDHGKCTVVAETKGITQCWSLEYIPAVTGVLTSYTTGFMVSCTSLGSPVTDNQSCSMTPNNRVIDGCGSVGLTLLNSSGNTGTLADNQITAGKAVTLHQVCFSIPAGESITVEEDPVTDLTTSVDLGNQQYVTEFPVFQTVRMQSKFALPASPAPWLDFQAMPAGPLTTLVDWSAVAGINPSAMAVERSQDGETFVSIGYGEEDHHTTGISLFRMWDYNARPGLNYYRLRYVGAEGKPSYSPVKQVRFEEDQPAHLAWPNPADHKVFVRLKATSGPGTVSLLDASGKERNRIAFEDGQTDLDFDVRHLEAGTYTLMISVQGDIRHEKIVILHR